MKKDNETLKRELCNQLIRDGKVKEFDIVKHSYTGQIMKGNKKAIEKSDTMITLTTRGDCYGDSQASATTISTGFNPNYAIWDSKKDSITIYDDYNSKIREDQNTMGTITTNIGNSAQRNGYKLINNDLRIRKLTPKECFRLMGVKDEDYEKIKKNQSDASLYHLAGDSIVVDVLMAIYGELIEK